MQFQSSLLVSGATTYLTLFLSIFATVSHAAPAPDAPAIVAPKVTPQFNQPTVIQPLNISRDPISVFSAVLNMQPNPDADLLKQLVAFDATYVSLSPDNPDLHAILPWAGTRYKVGPQAFLDTFTRVGLWWTRGPFQIDVLFEDGTGNVTAWGTFEITSNTMGKALRSPWSSRAQINKDGYITYFQYMEDTFATTSTFWADGKKEYRASPYGGSVWY